MKLRKEGRGGEGEKKAKKASVTCGTMANDLTYMSLEFQKERGERKEHRHI